MTRLDPFAVSLEGTHLIEASAGTGKTYTLATLYLRLLLERRIPVREILVVTYTNAATAELRTRIRERLVGALSAFSGGVTTDETLARLTSQRRATAAADCRLLTDTLYSFDEAAIFTIHGFCQRVLLEHAFESGAQFDTELVTDQTPLVDEVVRDFWTRELYGAPQIVVRSVLGEQNALQVHASLVETVVAHRGVTVLPEESVADIDGAEAEWRAAHERALSIWRDERQAILDLLHRACAGLDGRSYSVQRFDSWAPGMDEELAKDRPGIAGRWKQFENFTTLKLARVKRGFQPPTHPFFSACDDLLATDGHLSAQITARRLGLKLELLDYARDELKRRKDAANTQSFDDLLHRLDEALGRADGALLAERVRARFRAALIDEFQDTDPLQYRIFRRLYHGCDGAALFLIGDPKQAIYAFRGADVFAYIGAKRDAGKHTHTLDISWRADPGLVRAVNGLFGRADAPFLLAEIPFQAGEARPGAKDALGGSAAGSAPLEILFLRRRDWGRDGQAAIGKGVTLRELPAAIAAEISRFLQSGATIDGHPVRPSDIAVLCRTNDQAARMQAALRVLRVPSVLQGDASVFDAAEAGELERVLRGMAEPGDAAALRAALATPILGLGGNDLAALQDDESGWEAWADRFQRWHSIWHHSGFVPAFRRMLDDSAAASRLLRLIDGERRLTNLLHLGELLQTATTEVRRGPLALVEWLVQMRLDVRARSEVGGEAAQVRLESDREALQLTTVHKSKGLEYPIVYCPFLWDGRLLGPAERKCVRFHDPADGYQLKFDLGSGDHARHEERAEHEALAENLRLLYVATTRAKHRCTLVWGAVYRPEHSALGYILHRPPGAAIGDLREAAAARIRGLSDKAMRDDLEELASASDGSIEVRDLPILPGTPYEGEPEQPAPLHCRAASRVLPLNWRTGSFSSLVAQARLAPLGREAEEGADYDEEGGVPPAMVLTDNAGDVMPHDSPPIVPHDFPTVVPHDFPTIVLHDFPAGARPGILLHQIFEALDFASAGPEAIRHLVDDTLRGQGFDPAHATALGQAIGDVLDTPLDPDGRLRLRRIAMNHRLAELEFIFPVAERGGNATAVDSRSLAALLDRHEGDQLPESYIDEVRNLGFTPLAGYLKGYIDLVFEHADQWYVVDYKSNFLGTRPEDYRPDRLLAAMQQHHYFLQSYLYAVAVHRYLSLRLAEYDYDRHFGGVFYLFVRGMSPHHPRGYGIHRDRPSRALIEALSELLAAPDPSGDEHAS